jgi:hypothetical protein
VVEIQLLKALFYRICTFKLKCGNLSKIYVQSQQTRVFLSVKFCQKPKILAPWQNDVFNLQIVDAVLMNIKIKIRKTIQNNTGIKMGYCQKPRGERDNFFSTRFWGPFLCEGLANYGSETLKSYVCTLSQQVFCLIVGKSSQGCRYKKQRSDCTLLF